MRFVLVGGHAVAGHGEPRFTEDLDVFVEPTLANARRLRAALVDFGVGEGLPPAKKLAAADKVFVVGRKPNRIDSYPRRYERGRHTTRAEHMPKAHRAHAEWSPSRIISWASTIGAQTAALVEAILVERRHPEQGYRSCSASCA